MSKLLFALIIAAVSCCSYAESVNVIKQDDIQKILKTVPSQDKSMPYNSIADRLPNLGLSVNRISYGKLEMDEVKASGGQYKPGDVLYQFYTNEPNSIVKSICSVMATFNLIKRGKTWLPDSRTANFIVANKCAMPMR